MKEQSRLSFITKSFNKPEEWTSLRGVIAKWEENTMYLSFFFDGNISENTKENASILATEILAQFETGFLKEQYIRLDYPQELPFSDFWAYKR